jgi:hypothetical protein
LKEGKCLEFCDITLPKSSETNEWFRSSQTAREIGQLAGFNFDVMDAGTCQKRLEEVGFNIMPNTRQLVDLGQWKPLEQG